MPQYRRKKRYVRNNRRKKRWYVDARFGANVPVIGGTGFQAGSGLNSIIKRQALKSEETKKRITAMSHPGLTHHTLYTTQLNFLQQGTKGDERIGDNVYYCGFNIKYLIKSNTAPSLWRMYVVRQRQTFNPPVYGGFGTGFGTSDMYRLSDASPTGYINSDIMNVVCAKTIKIVPRFSGEVNQTREGRLNCKVMKKFQFRTGSAHEGEYHNYYLVVTSQALTGGTSGTTNIGDLTINLEQVFKDS